MKKLIFSLFGLLLVLGLSAQTSIDNKKLTRAERKEIKAQERAERKETIIAAIQNQQFVIEAYILEDRYGRFFQVSPMTNFVLVDSTEATIQFALPGRIGGWNGLGGITDEGRIRNITFSKKMPKYGVSFEMDMQGPAFGSSRVYVDVNDDGQAVMRFSGAFGARFSMRGNFELLEDSNIYKAMASF